MGEIEGDQTPPEDYCCGRYASYWNAFLFTSMCKHECSPALSPDSLIIFFVVCVTSNFGRNFWSITTRFRQKKLTNTDDFGMKCFEVTSNFSFCQKYVLGDLSIGDDWRCQKN